MDKLDMNWILLINWIVISLIFISLIVNWLVMEYKLDSELLLIDKLDN